MSGKVKEDKTKQLQDKCQSVLNGLLRDEDNKYCVDCDSKGPRWASWNIGVFLCIRCAGIHRNLGVHISKVKSVNLDAWRPEQVVSLQQMGNSRARAVYEANLPDNFRRPQNDLNLESFIRAKYEHKKYIAREWVQPAPPIVNWEKEIDEEIEKQKRKKKAAHVERKALGAMEVPQLPKPKNASPKPNRAEKAAEVKNGDLLGLQNGDDSFSGFVSAPPAAEPPKSEEKIIVATSVSEEESFFNQTIPTEKEKIKLTKDSILALYANAPTNQFTTSTNQFSTSTNQFSTSTNQFVAPTNQFQTQMPYQGNFPANVGGGCFAQQANNFPISQFSTNQQQQQQFPNQNYSSLNQFQNGSISSNQFQNGANFGHFQSTQFQQQVAPQVQPAQFGQFSQFNNTQPNQFFGGGGSLQQQFTSMNLGASQTSGKTVAPPTLAGNIWQ